MLFHSFKFNWPSSSFFLEMSNLKFVCLSFLLYLWLFIQNTQAFCLCCIDYQCIHIPICSLITPLHVQSHCVGPQESHCVTRIPFPQLQNSSCLLEIPFLSHSFPNLLTTMYSLVNPYCHVNSYFSIFPIPMFQRR